MTPKLFVVEARRSGKTIVVRPDQSIAEALICADIDVPLSCESGICGTCLTMVIDGLPDHRDSYLSADEHAANKEMTLCCSRSFSEKLVLDI
jgi:vanillate O-demethylase ferredoxin subunit